MATDGIKWPRFIIHDVCQWDGFSRAQRRQRINKDTVEGLFYKNMEQYSDVPMEMAVLGEGVEHYPGWVKYIVERSDWTVSCHGLKHIRYDLLPEKECKEQLKKAKDIIESAFETTIDTFIPPFNKYNNTTRTVAKDLGMKEHRAYRGVSACRNNISKCSQLDSHYWDWKNNVHLGTVIKNLQMKPPIIIVGSPRSGTTAYMRYVASQLPDYLALKEHERFWNAKLKRTNRLKIYYARQLLGKPQTGIIDKNVRNTFRILKIKSVFPDAQFIFIYRDPRAAISSWRDWAIKTRKEDTSIAGAAEQWCRYVNYWLDNRDKLNNWKEERYEDLCSKIDYFKSRNYKWQRRLTSEELKVVNAITRDIAEKVGY